MKLSELIAFRNRLNELTVKEAENAANFKLDILTHYIEHPIEKSIENLTTSFVPELYTCRDEIKNAFSELDSAIEKIKQKVNCEIGEQERHWFQESYKLFEQAETCETTEQILNNRREQRTDRYLESEIILRARLSNYADWRFSGIIIRPGTEDFIDDMVGCDPLYIVDRDYDLLKPAVNRFPELYQNRLRLYTTNDWSDKPILDKIPNNQFGICLAYNVFNYRPLEIIRKYLQEIYQKLRPGGSLLMTFNDCDNPQAVMLVERCYASYTPGYLIRDLAESIGFIQKDSWGSDGPSVWLELCKPGVLNSLRGGQTIGKIKIIGDHSNDIDFLQRKVYTNTEIKNLQNQARELGISHKVIKRSQPFELYMLIQDVMEQQREQEIIENARKHQEFLLQTARDNNIDIRNSNWAKLVEELLQKKQEEQRKLDQEQARIEKEKEKKRIEELHDWARSLGIDPSQCKNELEITERIAEEVDRRKKEELKVLRQRALELEVGDPNLIRYGYSAEKLMKLIKEKENK